MIDDHQEFMGDGHCRFLSTQARCKTAEGPAEVGGRFARRPRTLHQHTSQIAIAFPHTALPLLACTLVVTGTHPRPGGQPRGRAKAAHIRADLREDGPGGGRLDAWETGELFDLRREGAAEGPKLLVLKWTLLYREIATAD